MSLTVDLERQEVRVPVPAGGHVLVDPRERREDVVRRLLELGVSARTLHALLPEWTALISHVAATYPGRPSERGRCAPESPDALPDLGA